MGKKGNRLSSMVIDEISLVKRGANQGADVVFYKGEEPPDYDWDYIEKREFSTEHRSNLADKGKALPDGSFPIVNAEDLRNAIKAIGRAGEGKRAAVMAHIKKRAKQLGLTNALPEDWVSKGGPKGCARNHRDLKKGDTCAECGYKAMGKSGRMRKTNDRKDNSMPKLYESLDLDELDEDVRKALEELRDDNIELAKAVVEAESDEDDLEDDEDDIEDEADDDTDGDEEETQKNEGGVAGLSKSEFAALDPAIQKALTTMSAALDAANETAADAVSKAEVERVRAADAEAISKAGEFTFAKADDLGPALRVIRENLPDAYKQVTAALTKAQAVVKDAPAMRQNGKVTKGDATTGDEGTDSGDIIEQVNSGAQELRKSDGNLSIEEARIAWLKDHPDVYDEYVAARRAEVH